MGVCSVRGRNSSTFVSNGSTFISLVHNSTVVISLLNMVIHHTCAHKKSAAVVESISRREMNWKLQLLSAGEELKAAD